MQVLVHEALVQRYNRPGPRYTSYPTAPLFNDSFREGDYRAEIEATNRNTGANDLSLYVHLPFCRALCYYCGCHMMVTHRPEKIANYLDYVEREIDLVHPLISPDRRAHQVHWGGGTPSYLEAHEITRLMGYLSDRFKIAPDAEISMEVDPRGLTRDRLEAARAAGFNRISMGVQDFDPTVQQAIGRIQPEELVRQAVDWCRELDYHGVSFDLIYGLPHQTYDSFQRTLDRVIHLAPDRISLFSYAHVPWIKKHQTLIDEKALPQGNEKLRIFLGAIERLTEEGGYRYIGMDHFARPDDTLARAQDTGTMYRNFQGYTTHAGSDLVAFGISGISMLDRAYAQNVKDLPAYYKHLDEGRLPIARGVRLSDDDVLRRHVITRLMCDFGIDMKSVERRFDIGFSTYFERELERLGPLEADGLVTLSPERIVVTDTGRLFIRNVAMVFDAYLPEKLERPTFSKTI